MILIFRTDRSGQTVQTQIRLLLEVQSDQGLHFVCYSICVFLTEYPKVWSLCLNLRPQSHIHDFGHGRAKVHPYLSNGGASA